MEMKILFTDSLWQDVIQVSSEADSISLKTLKSILEKSIDANVAIVVRCKRCVYARPIAWFPDKEERVCLKHKTIVPNGEYFCADGKIEKYGPHTGWS